VIALSQNESAEERRKEMRPLKSIAVSFNARFKQAVNQLENHEAVAESIIAEVGGTAARARVQLSRIKDETRRLENEVDRLREEETAWITRAKKVHGLDEDRALECVRRLKKVRHNIKFVDGQVRESTNLEMQLTGDLSKIEERLALLRHRKKSLSGRQHTAKALKTVQEGNTGLSDEISGIFTRWETQVTEWEIRTGENHIERDEFEEVFTKAEEEEDLKKCLKEIVTEEGAEDSSEGKG
jgi:phage shock protein A